MIDKSNINITPDSQDDLCLNDLYNTTVQEYVEIIRDLVGEQRVARVKDIAELRGVTRSSVSTALNNLRDLGLIEHEHYGYVSLTDDGRRLGEILTQRHSVILRFLHDILGLELDSADEEACKLEHSMGPEALRALVRCVGTVEGCPRCGPHRMNDGL